MGKCPVSHCSSLRNSSSLEYITMIKCQLWLQRFKAFSFRLRKLYSPNVEYLNACIERRSETLPRKRRVSEGGYMSKDYKVPFHLDPHHDDELGLARRIWTQ